MSKNIVNEYFKKEFNGITILVKVNPVDYSGTELIIKENGEIEKSEMQFDEEIYEDLKTDDFKRSSPIEFNLYLSGLINRSSP